MTLQKLAMLAILVVIRNNESDPLKHPDRWQRMDFGLLQVWWPKKEFESWEIRRFGGVSGVRPFFSSPPFRVGLPCFPNVIHRSEKTFECIGADKDTLGHLVERKD